MADELELLDAGAELETEGAELETEGAELETEAVETETQADLSPNDIWKLTKEKFADNPGAHRQIKNALRTYEELNKTFPEGIKKTAERLELFKQLDDNPGDPEYVPGSTPIEDVISNTIAERTFWREFDTAFQAADPKVIASMIDANPTSFQRLVPAAFDRYADLNPSGFSTLVCQSVQGYLNDAKIPLQLALLEQVLPPLDANLKDPGLITVVKAFQAIKSVIENIEATAKKPVEVKAGQTTQQTAEPGADLESREMNLLHDEWLREIRPRSESATVSEVQKQFPGKRFTPAEVASIRNAVKEEVNARVRTNTAYQGKVKSLLKAKNKAAYAMTVESEHKKIIPGAVKRAVQDVIDKRKGQPVKKTTPTQTKSVQQTSQNNAGDFELIAKSPTRLGLEVDFKRTSNAMMAGNKAYIVGRDKPVRWKR